jgi:hypothetical protein
MIYFITTYLYLGVYGLLGTSAVFMLQGAIQEMIVCIPTKASADERRFESSVFTFVNQYCWMAEAHITKDRNASAGREYNFCFW